jgi:hypothetical protein
MAKHHHGVVVNGRHAGKDSTVIIVLPAGTEHSKVVDAESFAREYQRLRSAVLSTWLDGTGTTVITGRPA